MNIGVGITEGISCYDLDNVSDLEGWGLSGRLGAGDGISGGVSISGDLSNGGAANGTGVYVTEGVSMVPVDIAVGFGYTVTLAQYNINTKEYDDIIRKIFRGVSKYSKLTEEMVATKVDQLTTLAHIEH